MQNILVPPKTVMKQAGYELVKGIILDKKALQFSVKELKNRGFYITKEYMEKYELTNNSKLYINFDIEITAKYIK